MVLDGLAGGILPHFASRTPSSVPVGDSQASGTGVGTARAKPLSADTPARWATSRFDRDSLPAASTASVSARSRSTHPTYGRAGSTDWDVGHAGIRTTP